MEQPLRICHKFYVAYRSRRRPKDSRNYVQFSKELCLSKGKHTKDPYTNQPGCTPKLAHSFLFGLSFYISEVGTVTTPVRQILGGRCLALVRSVLAPFMMVMPSKDSVHEHTKSCSALPLSALPWSMASRSLLVSRASQALSVVRSWKERSDMSQSNSITTASSGRSTLTQRQLQLADTLRLLPRGLVLSFHYADTFTTVTGER